MFLFRWVGPILVYPWVGVHRKMLLMSWPYFASSAQHVFIIFFGWFMRWETCSHTAAVLSSTASRIWSKQQVTSLCSFHLAFLPSVLLESKWCNPTTVLTWLKLWRIPFLFYERNQISIWSITIHAWPLHIIILVQKE